MLRRRLTAVLIAVPLAVAGCSADDPAPAPAGSTAAQSGAQTLQAGQEVDSDAFFEDTQKAMLEAKTYSMTVRMEGQGETMTMSGVGDIADADRPKADMTMSAPGSTSPMKMILDGENVYMQMPGVAPEGKYVQMPISVLSQTGGQDVTQLMNPAENLKLTQQAVDKVTYQGTEDVDGASLQRYQVSLDPQKLQQAPATQGPSPMPSAGAEKIPYDVWVDAEHRVRKMVMNIEGTTMTMTAGDFGKPVTIAAPPSASVTQMPGLSGPASQAPASPAPTTAPTPTATPSR